MNDQESQPYVAQPLPFHVPDGVAVLVSRLVRLVRRYAPMNETKDTSYLDEAVGDNAHCVSWASTQAAAQKVAERIALSDPSWVIEDHRGDPYASFAAVIGVFDPDLIPEWAEVVWRSDTDMTREW